ncbi:hypothetical protein [Planotetraspora sp. GP83]|uniref:hypothetical protein n=1 Tax=Planotetraspora sp. GP83 TaxID=3156264 RepID=UPI003518408C
MRTPTVVVAGTGALAGTVCHALAARPGPPARVVVVGRRTEAAGRLARSAGEVSAALRLPRSFTAHPVDTDGATGMADAVASHRPDVVVQCASWHYPWEARERPSAWTDLIREAGFGATLPLQAAPAALVAAAVPGAAFVNGCLPDMANPVLRGLGLPVFCGIGNAATLWDGLAARPGCGPIRLLAHHLHLHQPDSPADEALAWEGERQVADVGERLRPLRSLPRAELNDRAGGPAALLVSAVLGDAEARMSVPGPLGLPGGYPVVVSGPEIRLDLPAGMSEDVAVAWNHRMSVLDGAAVEASGRVAAGPAATLALLPHLPRYAGGFDLDDLSAVARALTGLRDRLRRAPSAGTSPLPPRAVTT